jgi:hypothetical protein
MSEMTAHPDEGGSTSISLPTQKISTPVDFWRAFRTFPLQFDEYCFTYWYFLVGAFILIVLAGATIYDTAHAVIYSSLSFPLLTSIFTTWTFIPLVVTFALVAGTFNAWRRRIPPTFQTLIAKQRVRSTQQGRDLQQEYQDFLDTFQQTLLSNKRYIPVASIMMLSLVICLLSTRSALLDPTVPHILWPVSVWTLCWLLVLGLLVVALIWGYFFGIAAWTMGVTGWYVKKLTSIFDIIIQPRHPDRCGGLKILGDFCFAMALPLLIGAILLGIWGIGAALFPSIIAEVHLRPIFAFAGNAVLFLFALPLAFIAFFLPLWDIHRKMVVSKGVYEDSFAERLNTLEERIQSSLEKGTLEEAKAAKEEMDILQAIHPDTMHYPTWPFDRRILLTLLTTQIIPAVNLIIQVSQWLKH